MGRGCMGEGSSNCLCREKKIETEFECSLVVWGLGLIGTDFRKDLISRNG
jgi:hypothetical protein